MAASKAAAPAVESVEPVQEEPKVAKTSAKGDDLKKSSGIGPKIEELIHNAGIITFADLSKADVEAIKRNPQCCGFTLSDA
ncbi:MAG: hypothetical protein IPJ51_14680 [Saprospiraceae bacterium]|nr:hypothetical protein [Saprospiraceae bacterium]